MKVVPKISAPPSLSYEVRVALQEDLGINYWEHPAAVLELENDLSSKLLGAAAHQLVAAELRSNSSGVLCGRDWFEETLRQCGGVTQLNWQVEEGAQLAVGTKLCTLQGQARTLLVAERSGLNFLQLLSGVATRARKVAELVASYNPSQTAPKQQIKILDTRKTIPGLRQAMKYAVRVGGCENHRAALSAAVLLKENHLLTLPLQQLLHEKLPDFIAPLPVIVEVENLAQVAEVLAALAAQPETLTSLAVMLLDNFSPAMISQALQLRADYKTNYGQLQLPEFEISGAVTLDNLHEYLSLGAERISLGYLTKDFTALDFSLRFNHSI